MPTFFRGWQMINVDTGETLRGSFEATDLTENPGQPNYASHTTLSRQDEILQFLNGSSDELSFTARLYGATFIESIKEELNTLKLWRKKIDRIGAPSRPPIIVFMAGLDALYMECIIAGVSGIQYDRLTFSGDLRGATMNVTLRSYVPFEISGTYIHETRYHRAKQADYYELLAYYEYGTPDFGDLVRRRHPSKLDIEPADIIKLPSVSGLKTELRTPQSIVFQDSFTRHDTPQRTVREVFLGLRSSSYASHTVGEETV